MSNEQYRMVFDNEDQFSAELHRWVRNTYPETWGLFFHVPNGGKRNPIEAAKFKAMGVMRGIVDHPFICDGQLYGIELKLPGGTVSDDQKKIHIAWSNAGIPVFVCWDMISAMLVVATIIAHHRTMPYVKIESKIYHVKNKITTHENYS